MNEHGIFPPNRYFRSCHAATLAWLGGDNYVVAWFAGTHENNPDTGIWASRRVDGTWEAPVQVAKVADVAHWNPVLFAPGDGSVRLYFKVGATIPGWVTWVTHSSDGGLTWAAPRELVQGDRSGGRGPVKNKPIVLANGDWLAPASVETAEYWQAFTDRSSDGGDTWQASPLITYADPTLAGPGVIQPTLWESSPGQVHMLLRSTCGWICRSDSTDGGRSWQAARQIELPNPNSGIDLAQAADSTLWLLCNPTNERRKRTPLSLYTSADNGATWQRLVDLESDDLEVGHLQRLNGGEFSYPSIICHGDLLACAYTIHRKQIGFRQLSIPELRASLHYV